MGDGIGAGLFTDRLPFTECAQTDTHRHTEVRTVYPPVSLRSLGGYNNSEIVDNDSGFAVYSNEYIKYETIFIMIYSYKSFIHSLKGGGAV